MVRAQILLKFCLIYYFFRISSFSVLYLIPSNAQVPILTFLRVYSSLQVRVACASISCSANVSRHEACLTICRLHDLHVMTADRWVGLSMLRRRRGVGVTSTHPESLCNVPRNHESRRKFMRMTTGLKHWSCSYIIAF